jgi:uncharacterized membrane protein (DUF4010 family)
LGGYAAFLYFRRRADTSQEVSLVNPFELRPALTFGALYALILVVSRTAQLYFGEIGLYVSSALGGLADVNAITLSMAELSSEQGGLELGIAAQAVVLAVLANTLVRTGMVYVTGAPTLRRYMLPSAVLAIVATLAVALWLRATQG